MIRFEVSCGDWIYPSKDSSSHVQYPIDFPLGAEIFLPKERIGKTVSSRGPIDRHLTGPRYLEVTINDELSIITINCMKNREEELFSQKILYEISFCLADLPRVGGELPQGDDWQGNGVFFTSVLLAAHLSNRPLPEGITFRNAMIPEIESLGTW